ncbi:MAG: glycosyltransferase [Anaerolineae bacterium]
MKRWNFACSPQLGGTCQLRVPGLDKVMQTPRLNLILYDWHAQRTSASFHDVLIDPLSQHFTIRLTAVGWDQVPAVPSGARINDEICVYCLVRPSTESLQQSQHKVVWVPMWDEVHAQSLDFWRALPANLRILSFCSALTKQTRAAGLDTFDVRYFCDPAAQSLARWDGDRVAFYWNRRGLVSPRFLERWCEALRIDCLLYKPQLDPFVPQRLAVELPRKLGKTLVETLPHFDHRDDFFRRMEPVNIFLAPRAHEGIGLAFLEAMARGCAVFAFDGATMNEYIQHGQNGFLFSRRTQFRTRALGYVRRPLVRVGFRDPAPYFFVQDEQPWDEMSRLDLPALGKAARAAHVEGYARWQADIPKMADFIRDGTFQ